MNLYTIPAGTRIRKYKIPKVMQIDEYPAFETLIRWDKESNFYLFNVEDEDLAKDMLTAYSFTSTIGRVVVNVDIKMFMARLKRIIYLNIHAKFLGCDSGYNNDDFVHNKRTGILYFEKR